MGRRVQGPSVLPQCSRVDAWLDTMDQHGTIVDLVSLIRETKLVNGDVLMLEVIAKAFHHPITDCIVELVTTSSIERASGRRVGFVRLRIRTCGQKGKTAN